MTTAALAVTADAIAYPATLSIQDPDGASEMDLGRVYSRTDLAIAIAQLGTFINTDGWYLIGTDQTEARVRMRL